MYNYNERAIELLKMFLFVDKKIKFSLSQKKKKNI